MKLFSIRFAWFFLLMLSIPVEDINAQGNDNASNGVYDSGWINGYNGGAGFSGWTLSGTGNHSHFISTSTNNGSNPSGGIDIAGESWGLWAQDDGDIAEAIRSFTTSLNTHDRFTIHMDNGFIQDGGSVGFGLQDLSGNNLVEFFFRGGQSTYEVNDGQGNNRSTGVGFTDDGLVIQITMTTSTAYEMVITPNGGSATTFTGTLISTGNNDISRLRLFSFDSSASGSAYNQYFNSISYDFDVLPVELIEFFLFMEQENIRLSWSTATELNNSHFDIQRSANSRNWQTIGTVQGNGTTLEPQQYTFTDRHPLPGTNYYRLKQADYNGQFEYSKVVSVDFGKGTRLGAISPNPVGEELFITLPEEMDGGVSVKIFDLNGRIWQQKDSISNSLDVRELPQGVYFVKLVTENGRVLLQERFVKR